MNNQIISIAYSTFINKGAFALLLGSGISRKSGIPTGWEITLKLIAQIATLERKDPKGDLEQWYKDYFGKDPDYSDILEQLTNTPEERINLLRPFIEPSIDELEQGLKTPTIAHRQVARLVKDGYVKLIVTTNFDRLLENSLKDLGVEPTVISNPEHIENSIPLIHSNITIIKINGDYLGTKFLNIKSELEKYDPRLVDMLRFVFENFGLITCGWSAQWDIALVSILKSANKFRYTNYFTYLNRINSDLNDLSNFRKGELVKINDADSFFSEIIEDIKALEGGNDQHPLTGQIVLQRLKKYVVKEESIIALHDLFQNVTDDFIMKTALVSLSGIPNKENIKITRDEYLKRLDVILILITNAGYWAKEYQFTILLNSIKRITVSSEKNYNGNYTEWFNISYLPSLILRYALSIASIAKGNFKLVYLLATTEVQTKYKNEPLVKLTDPWEVISKDRLNEIEEARYHIPMSELVFKFLRPYFKELIPLDSGFDACFDYYEILYAIMYNRYISDDWYPGGKFAYKNNKPIDQYLSNAQKEGNNFELIKAGFFDSIESLKLEFNKFNEFFKSVRYR